MTPMGKTRTYAAVDFREMARAKDVRK